MAGTQSRLTYPLVFVFSLLLAAPAFPQKLDPAKWSAAVEPAKAAPGGNVILRVTAHLDEGWHLYSLSTPKGGPVPTTLKLADSPAVANAAVYQPAAKRAFDKNFNLDTETYEGDVVFWVQAALKPDAPAGPLELTAQMRYQVCNDKLCIPPVRRTASAVVTVEAGAPAAAVTIPAGYSKFDPPAASPAATAPAAGGSTPAPAPGAQQDLGLFLLIAFGFGLAAIFTPCVFPMIPITMSFFLNRPSGSRADSLFHASLFCGGIVVLFTGLGLLATAALGPFGIVLIGSNVWVNSFISVVFLAFGLSLLGAFEITLPSGLLTKLDSASRSSGTLGTLIMGLTFSLTSFACVGPIVGPLLVASVQGERLRPVLGMACFSSGLALPFFLLAMFPSYLKKLPRSGGWLVRVKIVLGFLVLAGMLKYLSNVDQVMQWSFLTRERFLAAWIVLFALPGLYLLGFLRMEGISKDESLSMPRLLTGAFLLIFSVSLLPGMFGARLGELDAYVPLATQQPGGGAAGGEGLAWKKNAYREALETAKRENKLVFVNFTGYACTNCHWMKANMFTKPEIAAALKDFVLLELYTDGTDPDSEANQKLQESRFSTIAIPYYTILGPDEKVVASFPGVTRDPKEFLNFLKTPARG